MRFSVTGHRHGALIWLCWEDGKLYGPPDALFTIRLWAQTYEGREVGWPEPVWGIRHHHLEDPQAAYMLMHFAFDHHHVEEVRGYLPPFDLGELPPGAVP